MEPAVEKVGLLAWRHSVCHLHDDSINRLQTVHFAVQNSTIHILNEPSAGSVNYTELLGEVARFLTPAPRTSARAHGCARAGITRPSCSGGSARSSTCASGAFPAVVMSVVPSPLCRPGSQVSPCPEQHATSWSTAAAHQARDLPDGGEKSLHLPLALLSATRADAFSGPTLK